MSDVPSGNWQRASLRELVDPDRKITYGIVQPGDWQEKGKGIALIRGQDYSSGNVDTEQLRYVHPSIAAPYARSTVKPGDILLSIVGYVGLCAEVPAEANGANITQTTARIAPRQGLNGRFLLHYFRSNAFREEVKRYTKGSAQPGLNLADVEEMKVRYPEAQPEQRTIAQILDTLDTQIRQTEALIAKLERIKQGLLTDLLTRGIDQNGQLRPTPDQAPHIYKDSPLGPIPREWDISELEGMAEPNATHLRTGPFGSALKGEHWVREGHPVITIGSLGEGEFDRSELLFVAEPDAKRLADFQLKLGDVVFSRVADVGRSVAITEPEVGWIMSSNLMKISLDRSRVLPAFLQMQLGSERAKRQVRANVNAGGRDVANSAIMNQLLFVWPNYSEQERICERLGAADVISKTHLRDLDALRQLKAGLKDDLLTGRVRVTPLLAAPSCANARA